MNPMHFFKELRFRIFYWLVTRPRPGLMTLGGACQWTFSERSLGPDSKVLCAGAGHDISFEKALIARYGCRVVLLDPSPTGIATVARENLPADRLKFLPIGLAGADETLEFQAPRDAKEGSFTGGGGAPAETLKFPCKTLPTVLAELGWTQLDLLKIDIEGFEFAVLGDVLAKGLRVRQICVEFHHGAQFGRARGATARMILALRKEGYELVHRVYQDHTFLLREP